MKQPVDTPSDQIEFSRIIRCPKCGRAEVQWNPAPDQRANEDSYGPSDRVPDYIRTPARISPPDASGTTHLLVIRQHTVKPSYWPAELSCPICCAEGTHAAACWNNFMGRNAAES